MTCSRGCCATPQEHWRSLAISKIYDSEKRKNKELTLYKQARDEGSLPMGTRTEQSHRALSESDRLGRPYRADRLGATYFPEMDSAIREWKDSEKAAIRSTLDK